MCHKQVFSACEKGAFFSLFEFFRKLPNFAGLWCPNHLTYRDSWGIYGKIISISFIWYLFLYFYRLPLGKSLLERDQLTSFLVEPLCLLWVVSPKVSPFFEGNYSSLSSQNLGLRIFLDGLTKSVTLF